MFRNFFYNYSLQEFPASNSSFNVVTFELGPKYTTHEKDLAQYNIRSAVFCTIYTHIDISIPSLCFHTALCYLFEVFEVSLLGPLCPRLSSHFRQTLGSRIDPILKRECQDRQS